MGQIQSEEYFEIKRAMEAFFIANNNLIEEQTRELIALKREVSALRDEQNKTNRMFGRATMTLEKKRGK